MKKKLEVQTILVLLCVLIIAGAWIGIQVAKDSLGMWSESAELRFETSDLLGLGPRAELRTAGAAIGHVRRITPTLSADGKPTFLITAGVHRDYASWTFSPVGMVRAGVVESALAPSSIILELSLAPDSVKAVDPKDGTPPTLSLFKEKSDTDFSEIIAQYRKLGDQIDLTIRQFIEPQNGRDKSVMAEFAEAIPSVANSLHQFDSITSRFNKEFSENGKLDQTLTSLNSSLARLETLTSTANTTVSNLNTKVDLSLGKVNSLLDQTSGTMLSLHQKVDGFGDTFFGRMIISKQPDSPKPSPSPSPKKSR